MRNERKRKELQPHIKDDQKMRKIRWNLLLWTFINYHLQKEKKGEEIDICTPEFGIILFINYEDS